MGRDLAKFTAFCRLAIGTGFTARPQLAMLPWIGADASRPSSVLLARAVGARDLVIAAGTLAHLDDPPARRAWLAGGLAADATDLGLTIAGRRRLPRGGRELVIAIAAGGVALGAAALAGSQR